MLIHYAKADDYSEQRLTPAVESVLSKLENENGKLSGKKVMLKPNLLAWRKKEDPACVNPAVILTVARLLRDAGAEKIALLENPGVQPVHSILKLMGIENELKKLGVACSGFSNFKKLPPVKYAAHQELEIANEFLEYDCVVNLAKAKTHAMMLLTLCVKNLFGFVSGPSRLAWHLNARRDFRRFADMLLDICLAVRPQYNLLDAVVCMEGNGPGSGTPAMRGFIAGAADALALDWSVSEFIGTRETPVLMQAVKRGLLPENMRNCGDVPEINPLKMPDPPGSFTEWGVGFPPFMRNFLRKNMLARPEVNKNLCIGCGLCAKMCPPKTLKIIGRKPSFDLETCIRCFCCQEHCPQGAITNKKPFLFSFLEKIEKISGKRG